MKSNTNYWIFGLIIVVLISGCNLVSEENKLQVEADEFEEELKQSKNISEKTDETRFGCQGEECHQYCQHNQEECKEFCEQSPDKCPIDVNIIEKMGRAGPDFCMKSPNECLNLCEKLPGICPEEMKKGLGFFEVEGPGGCKGLECKNYCQQDFQKCIEWCLENPETEFCKLILSAGPPVGGMQEFPSIGKEVTEVADPPKTTITFAKSFNLIHGQFTEEDILKAKELGANMVTFWPLRMVRNDEFTFQMGNLPQMIDFAHKNGLQVELRSTIIFPDLAKDYSKYKINAIAHAAEYAKLSEKYKVYRIVPFAEVDNDFMNHCSKITEFTQAVLSEMRKHYTGKIGIGVAAPWRDCGFIFKGYDYLSVSAYPHNDLATSINWAREVADKSSIPFVHVGETGVYNPGDDRPPDNFETLEMSSEKEKDYYDDFFTQFSDTINGVSIYYGTISKTAGGSTAMSINGDPAEEVVKKWYNRLYPEKKQEVTPQSKFQSCGGKKEFFTVSHIPISELQNIVPLGNLNPSGHTFPTNHLYFHLKGFSGGELASNAQVIAPGDIFITRIGSSEYTMRGRNIQDYKLDFTVCAEVRGYFIHLTSLSEKLLQNFEQPDNCEEYDTGGIHYKNCEKDFYFSPIFLAGGEHIGTAGGSSDFGLADLRTQELAYANPKRWYEDPLHRVCPLDYFTANVGAQLKFLLGSGDAKRTIEPICGEVAQDKAGTAQGVWFVKGTSNTYPEDQHISLVHDNINPLQGVFSVGTSMSKSGLSPGAYYFIPEGSGLVNRDFMDVKPDGNVYCYETEAKFGGKSSFIILMQLATPTTLTVEKQDSYSCGSGQLSFKNPTEFER